MAKAKDGIYEHGRLQEVQVVTFGSEISADTAAGATSLTVEDAADFDEDGGHLVINDQVIVYTSCDDDTGVIALAEALAADADEGDRVKLYDPLYATVVTSKVAQVKVDGDNDDADPIEATIALHLVDRLAEGIRGIRGESVLLELDDDEWRVVDVYGHGDPDDPNSPAGGSMRAEADDFHTITADDVTTDEATVALSYRPIVESLKLFWGGLAQEPTEYTIDYDAQTVTVPLDGMAEAGDQLWVHYWHHGGFASQAPLDEATILYPEGAPTLYIAPSGTSPGPSNTGTGDIWHDDDPATYTILRCFSESPFFGTSDSSSINLTPGEDPGTDQIEVQVVLTLDCEASTVLVEIAVTGSAVYSGTLEGPVSGVVTVPMTLVGDINLFLADMVTGDLNLGISPFPDGTRPVPRVDTLTVYEARVEIRSSE